MTTIHSKSQSTCSAVYTRRDMAGLLGVSDRTIDRLTAANQIPGILRTGRLVRYRRSVVDKWLSGESAAIDLQEAAA